MKRSYILFIILIVSFYSCTNQPKKIITPIEQTVKRLEVTSKAEPAPLYIKEIIYTGQLPPVKYFYSRSRISIRRTPSINSRVIARIRPYKKYVYTKKKIKVKKRIQVWYKIIYGGRPAFVRSVAVVTRKFRFEKMVKKIKKLELFIDKAQQNSETVERIIQYIPGEKVRKDYVKDSFGNRGEQSIRGFFADRFGYIQFRYLQDSRIIAVKGKIGSDSIIELPDSSTLYEVPYLTSTPIDLTQPLRKIIVIDIKNQNEAVFLKEDSVWKLISYALITTGKNDNDEAYNTPKGYFLVPNTVNQVIFRYDHDYKKSNLIKLTDDEMKNLGLKESQIEEINLAKNEKVNSAISKKKRTLKKDKDDVIVIKKYSRGDLGIRFSGGGYIHGIPLKDDVVKELKNPEKVEKRKKYSERLLGTVRRSHKCVRSADEHESFLYYDFVDPTIYGRIGIPNENVAVIIF